MAMIETDGVVIPGHAVASGRCGDPRFPGGTIRPQIPFIRDAIPDLEDFLGGPVFPGTINLSFAPRGIELREPEYVLRDVRWTEVFPSENFFLSRAAIVIGALRHPVLLYIPDPATKPDHLQPQGAVELLAAFVPGIRYGDRVTLCHSPVAILIR